jgi:phosphoribosylformimino-5-aminoimidazole carboxamide ribotide isomerase
MILFPAIDLKDGQCVRLVQGDMDQATVFSDAPYEQAKAFEEAGFEYLHIVDLNGAFEGEPVNGVAIEEILANVSMPTQLGGGIRDLKTIAMWLEKGISRVILGTAAVENPELVHEACRQFPNQVAVGLDARDGLVAVRGWAETSKLTLAEMTARFSDAGVAAIIFTDIARDGILTGLNLETTAQLAKSTSIPIIASGGLSNLEDIKSLLSPAYNMIHGAITGRALYDGRLDAAEALSLIAADKKRGQ